MISAFLVTLTFDDLKNNILPYLGSIFLNKY